MGGLVVSPLWYNSTCKARDAQPTTHLLSKELKIVGKPGTNALLLLVWIA